MGSGLVIHERSHVEKRLTVLDDGGDNHGNDPGPECKTPHTSTSAPR